MSYIVNKTNGTVLAEVNDTLIDQLSSDITLFGKDFPAYGELLNENFVRLLENFANTTQPDKPITGQIWYDTSTATIKVYDGNGFKTTNGAMISSSVPSSMSPGDFWLDTTNKQMYFNNGNENILLGPAYTSNQGMSGYKVETIIDDAFTSHVAILVYIADELIGIYSNDASYFPQVAYGTLTVINQGYNSTISEISYTGVVEKATLLVNADGFTIGMDNIVSLDGTSEVSGTIRLLTSPVLDSDAVNYATVKQRPLAISLTTTGLTNTQIASTYLEKLFPPADYSIDLIDGPVCRAVCTESGLTTIREFILTNGVWTYSATI